MTAINPARLKIQCAQLGEHFHDPTKFTAELHDLLAFYSTRIQQTSLSRTPLSLQSYQVPRPVLRTMEIELKDLIWERPEQALNLADQIWKEDWLEFRQLACIILGSLPPDNPQVVFERVIDWLESCTLEEIRKMIISRGLATLLQESTPAILSFIQQLASSSIHNHQQAALFTLSELVSLPDFENLPAVYKILGHILEAEDNILIRELSALLIALQKISDQETAFFLINQLGSADKPRIFRIIRNVLPKFSNASQQEIRQKLASFS